MQETVVIVGAGMTGLSVAYHTALISRIEHRANGILVLDAADEFWDSGSLHNTGTINGAFPEGAQRELAKYSYNRFRGLSDNDEFRRTTSIQAHAVFELHSDGSGAPPDVPGWVNAKAGWMLVPQPEDGSSIMINQKGFRDWLLDQCKALEVEIIQGAKVINVTTNGDGRLKSVHYNLARETQDISCQHLVLAAGAWTPHLLQKLFPASTVDLKSVTDALSWMIIRNPDEASLRQQITLLMSPVLGEGILELAARNDGTIFDCGEPDADPDLRKFTSTGVFEPVLESTDRFKTLLRRFVKQFANGSTELEVLKQGLSYRPTLGLGRPVIAATPKARLTTALPKEEQEMRSGVYACSGQGYYGITTSLGSGKVMSDIVLGLKPDIDVNVIGLPT